MTKVSLSLALITSAVSLISVGQIFAQSWPGWRGDGRGISPEKNLPLKWSEDDGVKWKTPIPGAGHSSPIVWRDRVFVTTGVAEDPDVETFHGGVFMGGDRSSPDESEYAYRVICLDVDGGNVLWSKDVAKQRPKTRRHTKNTYASETPVTDGKYVYASFGPAGLHAVDFEGNVIWKRDLGLMRGRAGWGTSSSPILFRNSVIVNCDNDDDSYIAAFDKATGDPLWRTNRDEGASWGTPFLFEAGGRTSIVTNASRRMRSYDAVTGKLQWECAGGSRISVPSPVTTQDLVPETNVASDFVASQDILRNWTSFRGSTANGHATHANPPRDWSVVDNRNIFWRTTVPKHGMSSPVIWDDRLFLTGADDSTRQVYCFETDTGKLLWQHDVAGIPGSPSGGKLPEVLEQTGFAAPTAATNGRYVAAIFATGELVCVNMKGNRIWAKHLGIPKNPYGHASSLISHKNLLIVQYDQKENSRLLAFDLASGNRAWQIKRGAISWSSPVLVDNKGRMELILTNCKAVDGYDPRTGERLWHVNCLGADVATSAAYADGVVFVAADHATASAIDVGSHSPEPKILWQWDEALPDVASPLANDEYLILPTGFGVVSCLDAKTGKLLWEQDFDDGFYSSPILVNDRVYVIDLSGAMQIFKMSDKFELLGVSRVGEDAYATPAFVGGRIYIRGLSHLLCIEERR